MTTLKASSSKELKLERHTTMQLCMEIDTPRALTVYLMLKYGEYSQYLELSIDPSSYEDVSAFRRDYLITKILSKSPNLPVEIDRYEAAVASFRISEAQCKATNDRVSSLKEVEMPQWTWKLKFLLSKLLPPLSSGTLNRILEDCSHGPGSTTGVRGTASSVVEKYTSKLELTANLYPLSRAIMGERWWYYNRHPREIVRGSRFTTVPKTAKTDRGICVEPTLNVFLQKGIGAYIRHRLCRFGLDLDLQAESNRDASRRAYVDELSTIDLSAASDSLALSMLERLIPPDWFHLLRLARSPCTKVQGKWVELEKISSMGNGFTFELESALFLMTARAIIPEEDWYEIHVFGDDIIVPRRYVHQVIDALNFLGFSVNGAKSFLEGNFFESCGTDWFKGKPVRPFFLKGSSGNIPYSVQIANKLRLFSSQQYNGLWCDSSFKPLWLELLKLSPKVWRGCRVTESLGDVGILSSYSELRYKRKLSNQEEGFLIKTVSTKPKRRLYQNYGILLDGLANGSADQATYGFRTLRGLFGQTKTRWTKVLNWPNCLEWDDNFSSSF